MTPLTARDIAKVNGCNFTTAPNRPGFLITRPTPSGTFHAHIHPEDLAAMDEMEFVAHLPDRRD